MQTERDTKNCKNCNTATVDKYCHNCGQPAELKRIDSHYVIHEIQHLFHVERGFIFTAKELLLRPGVRVREYLSENRNRLIKPIPFLVLSSLVTTLLSNLFHFGENTTHEAPTVQPSTVAAINHWVITHYGYANLMMGGLAALWIRLFFIKQKYNLYEISVLLCFVMGEGMIFFSLMIALSALIHSPIIVLVFTVLAWLYISWAVGQFYGEKKPLNYLKAFLAYTLGFFTFQYACVLVALVYDYFHK